MVHVGQIQPLSLKGKYQIETHYESKYCVQFFESKTLISNWEHIEIYYINLEVHFLEMRSGIIGLPWPMKGFAESRLKCLKNAFGGHSLTDGMANLWPKWPSFCTDILIMFVKSDPTLIDHLRPQIVKKVHFDNLWPWMTSKVGSHFMNLFGAKRWPLKSKICHAICKTVASKWIFSGIWPWIQRNLVQMH